ncbi:MAG: hypothetical protein AB2697_15765 [Candidatus Thiodiazotropha endolucinida]
MSEKQPTIDSVINEAIKNPRSFTEEERSKLLSEWADRTLNELLSYSVLIPGFQEKMYSSVIDHFSYDDELTIQMLEKIQGLRKGKRGRPSKWGKAQLQMLLMMYNLGINQDKTHDYMINRLVEVFTRLSGAVTADTIRNRLSDARNIINEDDLDPIFRSPLKE